MRGTRVHRLSHLQGATDGSWWRRWWCHLQHSVQVKLSKNPHSQWVMTSSGQLECKRISFFFFFPLSGTNYRICHIQILFIWWPTRFVRIYFCIYVPVFYESVLIQTPSKHVKTSRNITVQTHLPLNTNTCNSREKTPTKTGSTKSHWMFIFTVCSQYIFLSISTEGINEGSAEKN